MEKVEATATAEGPVTPTRSVDDEKVTSILTACHEHDLDALRSLATSDGGLINDSTRRIAWPILLGSDEVDDTDAKEVDWTILTPHQDEGQVQLDVDRSFIYYPKDESDERKEARKTELGKIIVELLRRHPMLHYFQGFHDICQVIFLVLGPRATVPALTRLSILRIRDFMLPTMSGTESHLRLLPSLLIAADPTLYHHLSQIRPFFALAATLTLYAHDIEEYGDIARLFDFLLAHEAALSLYLFTTIIQSRKPELLAIESSEPEMLHFTLSKLPKPLDLDALIRSTAALYAAHPPESLPARAWAHVSPYSVLKTTHGARVDHRKGKNGGGKEVQRQTIAQGEAWFQRHAEEIRNADERAARRARLRALARRYRRPALFVSVAAVVAVVAILGARKDSGGCGVEEYVRTYFRHLGLGSGASEGWSVVVTGLRRGVDGLRGMMFL